MEGGRHIRLAAEVGLLTQNIQIRVIHHAEGRLLVGSLQEVSVENFQVNHLKLLKVTMNWMLWDPQKLQ